MVLCFLPGLAPFTTILPRLPCFSLLHMISGCSYPALFSFFAFIVTGLFDRKLFPRTVPQDLSRVPYSLVSFVQYWSGISSVTLINSIVLGRRESFLQWWMKLKLTGIPWAVTESTWESRVLLCILTDSLSLQKALVREKTIVVSIMSEHFTCHPASDRQEMPYLN